MIALVADCRRASMGATLLELTPLPLEDHPLRYTLNNELHARPFPSLRAPGRVAYLALRPVKGAAGRDRTKERAHLIELLDRFGAVHPQPEATHYLGQIGKFWLKWESHSEFCSYMIFAEGSVKRPFDADAFAYFPTDWLERAPGVRMVSAVVRVETESSDTAIISKLDDWFVQESLAVSRVLEDELVVASDFRIDSAGHSRFAIFARPEVGPQRVGRVIQRLLEIETYKAMAMLGLARARALSPRLGEVGRSLAELADGLKADQVDSSEALDSLLRISAELETISAQSSFRFGATFAYEAIVSQRISILREGRFFSRQTIGEFMMRRFDPAMRTVQSTEKQLDALIKRAGRASDLLRTRVDVERSEENRKLLVSMDHRAALQLRLQQTVEGLSVVAISYYALSLAIYLATPVAKTAGIDKGWLAAGLTLPVVVGVWWFVRRIQRKLHGPNGHPR